jgi:hypothetical protein
MLATTGWRRYLVKVLSGRMTPGSSATRKLSRNAVLNFRLTQVSPHVCYLWSSPFRMGEGNTLPSEQVREMSTEARWLKSRLCGGNLLFRNYFRVPLNHPN